MNRSIAFCASLAATIFLELASASAQITWQPTAGGLFNTGTNWLPGSIAPGAGQIAVYDKTNTQTVTFETNVTVATHRVENGNVTFQLNQTIQTMNGGSGLIVGNTANLTGRLTLLNGKMTGDMTLGNVDASTGFLTIGPDAIFDALTNATSVGESGIGTLTVTAGGRYTSSGNMLIGNLTGSNGTVAVTGTGSSLATNTGGIFIGSGAIGSMAVTAGGTASGAIISIGDATTGVGSLAIGDAGSTMTGTGNFNVGNNGSGELLVASGGTLNTQTSRIALALNSTGSAIVTGQGATWNAAALAIGGGIGANGGAGTLQITAGGTVNVSGNAELRSTAGASLTIDGGTMNVAGNFTRLGTLNLIDGTLHVTGQFDNGTTNTPLSIDGSSHTDFPILQLSGSSGTLAHTTSISVGVVNQGGLIVDNGRVVNLAGNSLLIGTTATGDGSVLVTGSNSAINTTNLISIGGNSAAQQGTGTLTINKNASVSAGTLNIFPQGTLEIDSGTLNVATLNLSTGSTITFTKGRVNFTGLSTNLTTSLLDGVLGPTHELGAGRTIGGGASTLTVQSPLTLTGGTLSSGSGGPAANFSSLVINSGTLNVDATFTNNAGATLMLGPQSTVTAGSIFNQGVIVLANNQFSTSTTNLTNAGVIRGNGIITNSVSNSATGQIQITAGNRIQFTANAGSFGNSGIISVNGGELALDSGFGNGAGGLLSGRDGVIRGGTTGIANGGSIAFSGGFMDVYGDVAQSAGGRFTITGGGVTTFYDDVTIGPGANNIQVSASGGVVSSVVFLGSYNGGATGGGAVFIEGDHRPGNSPATVSFGGDTFYGAASHLRVELGGMTPGTQYDQVHVAGLLSLSGALDVSLINGFTPGLGNTFDILDWSTITGTFSGVSLPGLNSGLAWNLAQLYNTGTLSVVNSNLLPGDFNRDGQITAADIPAMLKALTNLANFAANNVLTPAQLVTIGDLDGSGTVTNRDIQGLLNLVATLGGGSVASVPEPGSAAIMLASVIGIVPVLRMRRGAR
jgi:fibronectin-binding autotransporter adhesin